MSHIYYSTYLGIGGIIYVRHISMFTLPFPSSGCLTGSGQSGHMHFFANIEYLCGHNNEMLFFGVF